MPHPTRIVLFGPQVTRLQWTHDRLLRLQSELRNNPRLGFLRPCLIHLEGFLANIPLGQDDPALATRLESLARFARGETLSDAQGFQSNAQLAPLTVVSQVVEWLRIAPPADDVIVQGFCIGFLSAAVISSIQQGENRQNEFERYVANSIRLAACVGLLIDAENANHTASDRATAISLRFQSHSDRAALESVLDSFPEVCTEGTYNKKRNPRADPAESSRHISPASPTTVRSPSPCLADIWGP